MTYTKTHKQTDIETYRKNPPKGRFFKNTTGACVLGLVDWDLILDWGL